MKKGKSKMSTHIEELESLTKVLIEFSDLTRKRKQFFHQKKFKLYAEAVTDAITIIKLQDAKQVELEIRE